MDFEKVIEILITEFEREKIQYALMGGFGMGVLGIMRATVDLDFLVIYQDLPKVEEIMEKYGYRCIFKSENVSQYVSDIKILGTIDFLHAFRTPSLSMLKRAEEKTIFGKKIKIKVLNPEDIIGLKLQALINNKSRENQEYNDIETIMNYFGAKLDWDLIKEYFTLFKKEQKFNELKEKYGKNK